MKLIQMKRGKLMSLTTVLSEILRFVRDKFKIILLGALLFGGFAVLGGEVLTRIDDQTTLENEEDVTGTSLSTEEISQSREYLAGIYEQKPAEFEMFVQLEDGSAFRNSFIFDEYFSSPEVIEQVENETGIEISDTLVHEQNLGLDKTSQYRGSIAGIRDTSNNVITIRVQVAETSEKNLAIIEQFAYMIINNEIPFAENLDFTLLREPVIGEFLDEDDLMMVSSLSALENINSPDSSGDQTILVYGVVGVIIGFLIMIVVLFIIQLFRKRISYAFQYSWDFNDQHILYSINRDDTELTELICYPEVDKRLVIADETEELVNLLDKKEINLTSSLNLTDDKPDEIVILIESNDTEKQWYINRYKISKMYKAPVKIIQINN